MSTKETATATTSKRKREKKEKSKRCRRKIERKKNMEEFEHLRIFLLAQLRAQEYKFSTSEEDAKVSTARFDLALQEASPQDYEKVKSGEIGEAMKKFFETSAKGDRWVPWHTVLCDHEKYLQENIYPLLSTRREQYAWMYIFSGSRLIPLFESIFLPILQGAKAGNQTQIELLKRLTTPEKDIESSLYRRNGMVHQCLLRYREGGKYKIHTSAYICRPPAGCCGLEYVFYICRRTWEFARLGNQVYNNVLADQNKPVTLSRMDQELQTLMGVGPTMSKMFTVSTQLMFPERGILENECVVGTGAKPAFEYLYPLRINHSSGRKVPSKTPPEALLLDLLEIMRTKPEYESLRTMIRFCSQRAHERFALIPRDAISDHITAYDLQVNLCEWRKFRKILPTESQDLRSAMSEIVFLVTCMNTKTTVSLEKKRKTYTFKCSQCKQKRELPQCTRYAWCGACDTIPVRRREVGSATISQRDFDVWFDHKRQAREDARIARRRMFCDGCGRWLSSRSSLQQHIANGRCKKNRKDLEDENFNDDNFNLVNLVKTINNHEASNIFSKCWIARDTNESSPMFLAVMSNPSPSTVFSSSTIFKPLTSSSSTSSSSSSSSSSSPISASSENDKSIVKDNDDEGSRVNGCYVLRAPFLDATLGEVAVEADIGLCHSYLGADPGADDVLCWDTH